MFRERSQKKNIIALVLIVWLLVEYLVMPVSALCSVPNQKTGEHILVSVEVEKNTNILTEIVEEVENEIKSEPIENEVENKVDKKPIENNSASAPSEQTTVESEVIDEYFDDAQITGEYAVPSVNTNFKSYTNYTLLSKRSIQWKLQENAYTDENGLRKIGNRYLAAMGSYYSTTIGDIFRLTTDTGAVFEIILCDGKSDKHTDAKHMYTVANNCMVEFYVDTALLNRTAKRMGSLGVLPQFSGSIIKVESLGHYEW